MLMLKLKPSFQEIQNLLRTICKSEARRKIMRRRKEPSKNRRWNVA
jgi:hypothetical protein